MMAAASAEGSVSEKAVIGIIGAIFTGLGVLFGKYMSQKNDVTVKDQPIGVMKHQPVVTWSDHVNLVRRVDRIDIHLDELRKESSEQFRDLLEAASSRESRIIKELHDVARGIHERIDNISHPKGGMK